jgi:tyrosine-protein phosphatase SIW14
MEAGWRAPLLLLLAASLWPGCKKPPPPPAGADDDVPNLFEVDTRVWRSGQPSTPAQWQRLKDLGVRHVVKLNFESEGTDDGARTAGLDVHVLSIQPEGDKDVLDGVRGTFVAPDPAKLAEAERVLAAGGGVLIHCTHGHDRTGLVVGMHRVMHDGWTKDAAYREMIEKHFHPDLHGLHEFWEKFDGKLQ